MLTRKKRILLKSIIILVILIIIAVILAILSFKMGFLKTEKELFIESLGDIPEELDQINNIFVNKEIEEKLDNNKYNENTKVKVNYITKLGTTAENVENEINKVQLVSEGKMDKKNNFANRKMTLVKEEPVFTIEKLQDREKTGIRFPNLYKQYLVNSDTNFKKIMTEIGYKEEELKGITEKIKYEYKPVKMSDFTEEEVKNINNKYLSILKDIGKEKFYKEKGKEITISDKKITANEYGVILTTEQLNNIFIKYLEMIQKDELILSKFGKDKEKILKELKKIEEKIRQNNIGNEENRVRIYEKDGKTIKFEIEEKTQKIKLEMCQELEFYQYIKEENEKEKSKITIKGSNGNFEIKYIGQNNEKTYKQKIKEENGKITKNISYIIGDKNNKIEANINNEIEIKDFNAEVKEKEIVDLNKLDEKAKEKILSKFKEKIDNRIKEVNEKLNTKEIEEVLIKLGVNEDNSMLEGNGVTVSEKNRFNARFEFLKGEKVEAEMLLKSFELIKDNINGVEVLPNNVLKIKIDQYNSNQEIYEKLKKIFKKEENNEYNVSIEYDENTKMVKDLKIEIYKEEEV